MPDRKNIFLIGRRRMIGDEDQLTEMLAFLWQEEPETLERWLEAIGLPSNLAWAEISTQFTIPSGKRPDIAISTPGSCILVESKLGAGFHNTQIPDYLEYLGLQEGGRALVLLTQRPEHVPQDHAALAADLGISLVARRWQDMARYIAEPGEESLGGDFVQLLIREGLVKPEPLTVSDWSAWNEGYNVLLRLDAFLAELGLEVQRMRPTAKWKSTNGLSKRWIYRVWRADGVELGYGFGASPVDKQPHGEPITFAFVGNANASEDDAMRVVGVDRVTRYRWSSNEQLDANIGLLYSGWAVSLT